MEDRILIYNGEYICSVVHKVKKEYGSSDPFQICKLKRSIKLNYETMGTGQEATKGFFLKMYQINSITVNSDMSKEFQRIILAHELGHVFLHSHTQKENDVSGNKIKQFSDTTIFSNNALEKEANIFAAELLIDDSSVTEYLQEGKNFEYIARELRVPHKLLGIKWDIMKHKNLELCDFVIPVCGDFLKDEDIPPNFDDYIC
ncbi:MAG: ImmA/IrrE family metallo-endopeptidase [Firmicutes bacterium]|nr:ImmA/IrrE family metallo-endopeptidase [Bacillota bacterium]